MKVHVGRTGSEYDQNIVCMYEMLKNNITLKARRQQSILELAGKTLPWQSKISFVSFEYL